jgi:hypothetical protein
MLKTRELLATLMWRSTVLSLPLQLVFPVTEHGSVGLGGWVNAFSKIKK